MARSGAGSSAIFASRSLSPSALFLFARSSAFSSLARSFIAAFSSSVNPLELLADVCVPLFVLIVPSFAGSPMFYPPDAPGLATTMTSSAGRCGRPARQRDDAHAVDLKRGRRFAPPTPSSEWRYSRTICYRVPPIAIAISIGTMVGSVDAWPSASSRCASLNRATLARQLLLERKRLSPTAVIERLVGMQAQWPPAPYVGIWTRTTSFRREALERELARGAVLKATAMRQTLHLVTRRDYGLLRAAMSEMISRGASAQAKSLAPSVRALAEAGPVASADALAHLEREHGAHRDRARGAPGAQPACAHTCCITTRRRSGTGDPRGGSWRSRSQRHTTRSRRAPRSSAAISPRSALRRAAT